MKKSLSMYFMTALVVGCLFRAGPDIESRAYPIIAEQSIHDVQRVDTPHKSANPVLMDQKITEVKRTNDSVCYTWTFTKRRDIPLSFMTFSVQDGDGVIYDVETTDMNTGEPVYVNPNNARWPVDVKIERHFCTTLPYVNDPLTVKGVLVYKTGLNLWSVTHFTPTIVVPKDE